jgi:hypothetical protein
VVVNCKKETLRFDIEWKSTHLTTEIRGRSVATYRWD